MKYIRFEIDCAYAIDEKEYETLNELGGIPMFIELAKQDISKFLKMNGNLVNIDIWSEEDE